MSRTRMSGWALLVMLAALPAVIWMGAGPAPEEHAATTGDAVSVAGFGGEGFALGGAAASSGVPGSALPVPTPGGAGSSELALLRDRLAGSFSSAGQASADTAYSDIRLHVVPVWLHRSDAHWLYAEQAAASQLDKPYRMRVYKLVQLAPDLFESRVYELPGEARFAGAWRKENPLGSVTPDSLVARAGCSIVLRRTDDGAFMGSTLGHDDDGELRGAAYASSEVRITDDRLLSWNRGFDAAGKQVWGAEKGPYEFLRVKE
jgi:CpeT protein